MSWLFNVVEPEIATTLSYTDSAAIAWKDLEDRHKIANKPQIFQMKNDISVMSQGEDSVFIYFQKLKSVCHQLDLCIKKSMCSCGKCTCNGLRQFFELEAEDRVLQFLFGLNEGFVPMRGQMLSSGEDFFTLIQQDEKYRSFHKRKSVEVANAYYVQYDQAKKVNHQKIQVNNQRKNQNKVYIEFGRNGRNLNVDLWCDHCERYNHTKDVCYKLVGYPKENKFGNQDKGKAQANMVQVNDGAITSTANNYDFTSDQVKTLQEIIKSSSSSGKEFEQTNWAG